MAKNRRLHKSLKLTKRVDIDKNKQGGFAYVIVPSDIQRNQYINHVYSTLLCSIVTNYNQVINNVSIPKELIDELTFPQLPGQYGTLVRYVVDENSQVSIVSTHLRADETQLMQENRYVQHKQFESISYSRTIDLTSGTYSVVVHSQPSIGSSIAFKAIADEIQSSINISQKQIELDASEVIELTVESVDSAIKIDKQIEIGKNAKHPVVLGDELKKLLKDLITACQQIQVTTMVAGAPVTSTPPINQSTFSNILQKIDSLLSNKVLVE